MATREEKIAFIQSKMAQGNSSPEAKATPSREDKIAFIQNKMKEQQGQDKESGGYLDDLVSFGKKVDSYTGAPARAFIGSAQKMVESDFKENPISAFVNQIGKDPDTAPTGKEIAQKAGVPNTSLSDVLPGGFSETGEGLKLKKGGMADISASGAAGLGVDLIADPTNFVPVGKIAKAAGRGAELAGKAAAETARVGTDLAFAGARKIPGSKTVGAVTDIVSESAKNTAGALKKVFTPTVSQDFARLSEIAKKNGIDASLLPESVEFGKGSFVSRAARHRAEGVLGEAHLNKFEKGLDAVRDATENKIAKIGGGSIPSTVEAGELIRSGYDDAVDNLFKNVDFTYNEVINQAPGIRLTENGVSKISSKLNGIEKFAKGQAIRGITNTEKGQAKQLLNAVAAVREGNGSLKQLNEAMTQIGKHAFSKGQNALADIPIDQKKFQDLYFTLREAFIDSTAAQLGSDVAQKLVDSNQLITNFNKEKDVVAQIIGNGKLSPEKVFASLVEHGDTQKIAALKNILPPEKFQRLKGSFLAAQIKRNADDVFSFKSLNNNLRNKKNVLGAILSPEEINDLNEIIELGSSFGEPVLSSSGTGASNVFRDIGQGIRSGVENDTVIDLMKDSARKRSSKAVELAKEVKEINPKNIPIKELSSSASASNKNLQRLAAISPSTARVLSTRSGQEKTEGGGPIRLRGKEMWAVNGFSKLMDQDNSLKNKAVVEKIFGSEKGRNLLIAASDLTPGSKAFNNVLSQIKKEYLKGGE